MKKMIALAALSAIAATSYAATKEKTPPQDNGQPKPAFGQHKGHGMMSPDGLPRGFERLNLSDAQKTKIKAIMDANRPAQPANAQAGQAEFEQRRAAEQALISSKTFDEAKARQMITEQQQKHADMMLKNMKMRHDVFQVLTPAQQKQWQEMRPKPRDGGMRGDHKGGMPAAPQGDMPQP